MSASEVIPEPATALPENPAELIAQVVTGTETVVQSVNVEEEVSALVQTAQSLATESVNATNNVGEFIAEQVTHEQRADENIATADQTVDEDASQAYIAVAENNIVEAQRNEVLANSASITAEESGAQAASLEQTASITRAVQEEMTRATFSIEEVENRTQAGVEQEIKLVAAAAEEAGAAHNLESELKAAVVEPATMKA